MENFEPEISFIVFIPLLLIKVKTFFCILNLKNILEFKIFFLMKVVSSIGSLKNRSNDCQIVKRRGYIYVICKSNPRFKVRQGKAKLKRKK